MNRKNIIAKGKSVSSKMKIILWCWDSRMTWDDEPGTVTGNMAVSDQPFPYMKKTESYTVGFSGLLITARLMVSTALLSGDFFATVTVGSRPHKTFVNMPQTRAFPFCQELDYVRTEAITLKAIISLALTHICANIRNALVSPIILEERWHLYWIHR